jgi:RHS repeat-associated protein
MCKVVDVSELQLGGQPPGSGISSPAAHAPIRIRTSTTRSELPSAFHYYGYRQLNPLTGRWINRDPIEEAGGVNLYGFVGNDGVGHADLLGFADLDKLAREVCCCLNFFLREAPKLMADGAGKDPRGGPAVKLPNIDNPLPAYYRKSRAGVDTIRFVISSSWKNIPECDEIRKSNHTLIVKLDAETEWPDKTFLPPSEVRGEIAAGGNGFVIPGGINIYPQVHLNAFGGDTGRYDRIPHAKGFRDLQPDLPDDRIKYKISVLKSQTVCIKREFYLDVNSKDPLKLGKGMTPGPNLKDFVPEIDTRLRL